MIQLIEPNPPQQRRINIEQGLRLVEPTPRREYRSMMLTALRLEDRAGCKK